MAPKNFKELECMLEFAIDYIGPIYIRYPRGGEESTKIDKEEKIELGKAEKLSEGNDYTYSCDRQDGSKGIQKFQIS